MRKKRLEKEYEKNTKAPGPGEEHSKEGNLKAATKMFGAQAREIMRLNAENAELRETIDKMKEGNPALEESATQFNDALLDEQVRKIDKQNKEITRLLSLVEKKENSISRLYYEKSVLEKENEELKKGEIPAKYFDKALVDEQAEKIKKLEHEKLDILEIASSCKQTIAELTKEKANLEDQITVLNACKKHNDKIDRKQIKCLGKEIARLNKIIHKKNLKIEELRKESSRHLREKMKMFGENFDLEQELKDKNAILSDVAEELRLSKIREKNLTEVSQKYMKENEELKKELDVAKKQNTAVMVDMTAKCFRAARESINDVFKSYAAKYVKSTLDDLKEKAYESFNAKACNLGLVGSKDGNGIFDQIVGVDNAEEGGDLSGVIVLCGKDFIDAIKKMK